MSDNNKEVEYYISHSSTIQGLSVNTCKAYKEDLEKLLDYLSINKIAIYNLTKNDASLFLLNLMNTNLSSKSINRILSSCRGFYKLAYRDKKICYNPFSDIQNAKTQPKLPTVLTKDEINTIFKKLDVNTSSTYESIEENALIHLLYSSGARRTEIVSINVKDLDFDNSQILIKGKGGKERFVFITLDAEYAIKFYLKERNKYSKPYEDALFINKFGERLTVNDINMVFNKIKKLVGNGKKITPHTMRHTYATHLMEDGIDIRTLQELLGHSSISTTGLYTHLSLKNLKDTYKKTHPHAQ